MKTLFIGLAIIFSSFSGLTQPASNATTDTRMEWWRDAKFGMFIHWGIYAVPAGEYNNKTGYGEWIMEQAKIPIPEYEKFAQQFNPQKFNAEEWVLMAKDAGMKYIVITSKHHDGFCLWDSKVSDYDVMDRTPFKRDIMKELSDACKKHDVVFCMYHSIMDWHHPDENETNIATYREEYLKPQLKELVINYDPGVLWFDGEWVAEWTEEQGRELYNWLREIKPSLIINNRVGKGRNGMQGMNKDVKATGDFGTPEQEILEEKNTLDWESCMTMNNHWGYNRRDNNWKTAHQLIWNLVDIVAKGGNYLLNVGPTAEGLFPDSSIHRLKEMGEWMRINQEAIYGIRTWEYYNEENDIRYARNKRDEIFAYSNGWPGETLTLRKITPLPGSTIELLGYKQKLRWKQTRDGVQILLPAALQNEMVRSSKYVYVFKLKGTPEAIASRPQIGSDAESTIGVKVISNDNNLVSITATEKNAVIYYTLDGSQPSRESPVYNSPIRVTQTGVIKSMASVPGKVNSETSELKIVKGNYAISLTSHYAPQYASLGSVTLVDGIKGNENNFRKDWLGFEGKNMEAVIDLGASTTFSNVTASFLKDHGDWIFLPRKVQVFVSDDGKNFQLLGEVSEPIPNAQEDRQRKEIRVNKAATARYIKIVAESIGTCPAWHGGNGGKAWIFADEIVIE